MRAEDIRRAFLDYFAKQGHTIVPSSSLVPVEDKTLLFTNAGMVQFKDAFLGNQRGYVRAASAQRCLRAGGKHNDLENVGYTARHHTFFEMLGNFSFGDYFKREAITFAWRFLTEILQLPPEKLWVTVFEQDDEAAAIWLDELKVSPDRFSRCSEKDNFWSMGDTGPCGPCTEIFYDHGPDVAGGPPGTPEADGDRYIEIWNLVFMQFNRNEKGELEKLPKPSVDTGMGLERIAAVMQGVHSNYEIDLFQQIIEAAAEILYQNTTQHQSLRVIADHIRSASFLITDGVLPSNEGRGYVLRRIIRRALRHGYRLGARETFFHRLVPVLVKTMGDAYPELAKAETQVIQVLKKEETQFQKTLSQGMGLLEDVMTALDTATLPGDIIFKLYDTYGFPVDLTADVAREKGLQVDLAGFEAAMSAQKERARQHQQFAATQLQIPMEFEVTFTGYHTLSTPSTCLALFYEGQAVDALSEGQTGWIVLAETPFYAESGGQVGDVGLIHGEFGEFEVTDTRKMGRSIVHIGRMHKGEIEIGNRVEAIVDRQKRLQTAAHHSVTHLLHAALKQHLGEHVMQKGSLVSPSRLRFDFTHETSLSAQDIAVLEDRVNAKIRENSPVETALMDMNEAVASGAVALFGEKYGKEVRVLSMGDGFSRELCGGTHVKQTGDIGFFKIISEGAVAAGIRRIEACAGAPALQWVRDQTTRMDTLASLLKTEEGEICDRVKLLLETQKQLEKQIERLQHQLAAGAQTDLLTKIRTVEGIAVLVAQLPAGSSKMMRETVDNLKSRIGSGVICLAVCDNDKVSLVAGITKDLVGKLHAGKLIAFVATQLEGKGGGRPDMAEGGGHAVAKLPDALASVVPWIQQALT